MDIARSHHGVGKGKLAAALTKGRFLLGTGVNLAKSHPLQARFADRPDRLWLHAEMDALRKALREYGDKIEGATMWVARAKKNGQAGMACPCKGCQSALRFFGVKEVIFTTSLIYSTESSSPSSARAYPIGRLAL